MIEKKILKKGQIVIPKTIRELISLHEGDKVTIEMEGNTIKIQKAKNITEKLKETAEKHHKKITTKEIKKTLKKRYKE
ncbi:MAG: AbrB/MazE/SpoVT family DNA-binding domain-containing protein [Candidatus Thermoplasmatota archaeon]